jgi:hypothetical protein
MSKLADKLREEADGINMNRIKTGDIRKLLQDAVSHGLYEIRIDKVGLSSRLKVLLESEGFSVDWYCDGEDVYVVSFD